MNGDRPEAKAERIVLFRKTKMCKFHILGVCAKGDGCKFAHQKEDLCPLPDLSRTKLCKTLISTGICTDPECTYAHNKEELRLLPPTMNEEAAPTISRDAPANVPMPMGAGVRVAPAATTMQPNVPPQLWQYIASLPADQAIQLMSNATLASAQVATMPWVQMQTTAPGCGGQTQMAAAIPVMVQQPMQPVRQPMQAVAQPPRVQVPSPAPAPAPAPAQAVTKRGWLHDAIVGDAHPAFSEPEHGIAGEEQSQPSYAAGHPADVAGGVPQGTRQMAGADAKWQRVFVKNTFLEVNTGATPTASKLRHTNTWAGGLSSVDDEGDGDFGAGFGPANPPWPSNQYGAMRTTDSAVSMISLQEEEERQMAEAAAKKVMVAAGISHKATGRV